VSEASVTVWNELKAVTSEPVFVNVYGAQESIQPARLGIIPGLLKRFTNMGSGKARMTRSLDNWKKNSLEKLEL
jgi:hypothetical protein